MTVLIIIAAASMAALLIFNFRLISSPDKRSRLKAALITDTVFALAGIAGAVTVYFVCINFCKENSASLIRDSFILFMMTASFFAAAVIAVYTICSLLTPRFFPLHFGFCFAAAVLLLIFTAVFSLLTKGDGNELYKFIVYYGISVTFVLSLSPAVTAIRLLCSPRTVQKISAEITSRKEGRKKKKSIRKA